MADLKISALPASTTPLAGTEVVPLVQSSTTKNVSVANLTAGRTVSMSKIISGNTNAATSFTAGTSANAGPNIEMYGTTSAAPGWTVYTAGVTNFASFGIHAFYKNDFAGAATFLGGWYTNGYYNVNTGNLVIGTSGKGIDFSATSGSGTSELLNDYEEGTWTPTNTNAITVNSAKYTKIGRIVICTFDITAGGSATTGDMGGLPFNATNPTSGGVLSYHNENGTETWSVSIEASGAAAWSFRLGSTQKQLSAGKNAKGMITYSL